jgi:hypothetical protein
MDPRKKTTPRPCTGPERYAIGTPAPSPGTDPTNPYNQEAAGRQVAGVRATERRENEPGLTDRDRAERGPTH